MPLFKKKSPAEEAYNEWFKTLPEGDYKAKWSAWMSSLDEADREILKEIFGDGILREREKQNRPRISWEEWDRFMNEPYTI